MARVIRDKWKRQGRTHCDNKPGDHEGIPSTGLVLRPDRSQTLPRPFLAGGQQDLNIVEPVHADRVHIPTANQAAIIPTPARQDSLDSPSPRNASPRKEMARPGTSGAFRMACARFPVFWAPERVWRQGKRVSVSGAGKNLAAECIRSIQWKDGHNHA